ncbi:MAG: nitrogenase component 1 [Solobacterium sp.]|nr:nitrogenase component 1 [Solobacterium sp.]
MRDWHTHVYTSTYTADVSGVCSAMYELGGMTVLHDPSGCNSTYTTHDEPRWYDSKSLMFVSGLDELTAVYGDDSVLINDVKKAAEDLKPRFITLCGASIPHIIAFDYRGTARLIEKETGIPVLPVATDGLKSYVSGVDLALREWIRRFADETEEPVKNCINLLGVTPIDFSGPANVKAMKKTFEDLGFTVNGCFAMEDSFENLTHAYRASVNVAVSSAGLKTARYMKARKNIPYVVGLPVGKYMAGRMADAILQAQEDGRNRTAFDERTEGDILVIGEEVYAKSMAEAVSRTGFAAGRGLAAAALWPDTDEGLDEDDLYDRVNRSQIVICDPLFFNVFADEKTKMIELPHEGYSGRIFRDRIPVFASGEFDAEAFIERGK